MLKRQLLYLSILMLPFLVMVVVNEYVRSGLKGERFSHKGITAINSAKRIKFTCTWNCHKDTDYCMEHHVKYAKPYFYMIDPIYFGIIHSLKASGNYKLANIIFLVILIPLVLFILLVRSISMELEIRKLIKKLN